MTNASQSGLAALLVSPALVIITVFMVVPIGITTIYSFLEPARYGGVIWEFSTEAYVRLLFERDIFDDSLSFSTDYLRIFVRSLVQAGVAGSRGAARTAAWCTLKPKTRGMYWRVVRCGRSSL